MRQRVLKVFLSGLLSLPLWAQSPSPPAQIEQFQWLCGRWLGQGLGDLSEETWNTALGGTMLGVFRQHAQGQPKFYEFMLIREHQGSVELRIRHFHPDATAWEEPDKALVFPLLEVQPNLARFQGLTYRRDGDRLTITVSTPTSENPEAEAVFQLKRLP